MAASPLPPAAQPVEPGQVMFSISLNPFRIRPQLRNDCPQPFRDRLEALVGMLSLDDGMSIRRQCVEANELRLFSVATAQDTGTTRACFASCMRIASVNFTSLQ